MNEEYYDEEIFYPEETNESSCMERASDEIDDDYPILSLSQMRELKAWFDHFFKFGSIKHNAYLFEWGAMQQAAAMFQESYREHLFNKKNAQSS